MELNVPDLTCLPRVTAPLLTQVVSARVPPAAGAWLDNAVAAHRDLGAFADAFTMASRRLGKALLNLSAADTERLAAAGIGWPVSGWGVDEAGRAAMLVSAAGDLDEHRLAALVEECYGRGDNRERQAVLKALPLLPPSERLVTLGIEACRTSIQPVFEAIACENPYPAARFPDLSFNQMVLKALFVGVAVDRIIGLDGRLTPELARMATDYASERRAAGRSVPGDIARITGGGPGGVT
jgi:hypothetical protein